MFDAQAHNFSLLSGATREGHGGAQTYDINALVAGNTDFGALRTQVNPDDAHGGNETTVKSSKIGEQCRETRGSRGRTDVVNTDKKKKKPDCESPLV